MRKLYKYTGTVSQFSFEQLEPGNSASTSKADIILNSYDDDISPMRIEAFGGLAEYINAIEWTDAEERYLASDWYYDANLFLYRIEVPSIDKEKPSKIIAQRDPLDNEIHIFGPQNYIEQPKPEPISREEYLKFCYFQNGMDYGGNLDKAENAKGETLQPEECAIKVCIRDFMKENEEFADRIFVYLEYEKEDDCDPMTDIVWDGLLKEVPEKYWECEVVKTAQSLRDAQEGKNGHYLTMRKENNFLAQNVSNEQIIKTRHRGR